MKYRKKPIVIEAFQMTTERMESNVDWPDWLHEAWNKDCNDPGAMFPDQQDEGDGVKRLQIATLEGDHLCEPDDFIIQGVKGKLYPCKPDIFEMTHEAVVEKNCPMPSHHPSCDCNGEGGDR